MSKKNLLKTFRFFLGVLLMLFFVRPHRWDREYEELKEEINKES